MVLIPFKTSGTERWILVGVMGATGFWLDVIMVILWSGIASTVMGIEGETQTAEVLDNFAGEEWSLINGLRFKGKGDIDHILIGPAGLLVFESKNVIGDIPIYLICVLWSREQSTDDDRYFFRESVYGIRGSELANWLAGLPKNIVSESVIKAVAAPIESFAHLRDQDDVLSDGPFRPTLDKLRVGSLVLPRVGIFIPAFVLAYVAILDQDTPIIVAMGILLLLGLLIRVILKMKALAYVNHWVTR